MRQIRMQGILVGHRSGFENMNEALASSALRPIIDRSFAFEDAPQALRYLESGAHFGKVCIDY